MGGLNANEKLVLESITSMLHQDAKLGLTFHDADQKDDEIEHGHQYLHEQIDDMLLLKAAELVHAESVTSAFRKVHSYKYIDDWTFLPAMEKEMISKAVPNEERIKALQFIPKIISELRAEHHLWTEKDSGFNPNLKEVKKVSQPEQDTEFKIHNRSLNKRNVEKPKKGDGSPARTNMTQPPLPDDGHDAETDPGDGASN